MAFVPGFKHDVFISYAHVDDPDPFDEGGWVARFERALLISLRRRLNKSEFSMWRDQKRLGPNYHFDDEIMGAVESAAVFLALNSPGYVDSEYCLNELSHFADKAESSLPGLRVGNASRIFRADLDILRADQQVPGHLEEIQYQAFYEVDEEGQFEERLRKGDTYENAVLQLARDVSNFLVEMKSSVLELAATPLASAVGGPRVGASAVDGSPVGVPAVGTPAPDLSRPSVFLAQATPDLDSQRQALKANFEQYGVTVLEFPDERLGSHREVDTLRQALGEQLGMARISIHLLGRQSGEPLFGDPLNDSLAKYEYLEAVQSADSGGLGAALEGSEACTEELAHAGVIVWTPPDVMKDLKATNTNGAVDATQLAFFRDVHREASENVEWLQQGIEGLKEQCFVRLNIKPGGISGSDAADFEFQDTYLLLHGRPEAQHHQHFDRIIECLENKGCDFDYQFANDEPLDSHATNYDGLLILHLDSPEKWASDRVKEAVSLVRRRRSFVAGVYDGPHGDEDNLQFGSNLVPAYPRPRPEHDNFECSILDQFFERLTRQSARS